MILDSLRKYFGAVFRRQIAIEISKVLLLYILIIYWQILVEMIKLEFEHVDMDSVFVLWHLWRKPTHFLSSPLMRKELHSNTWSQFTVHQCLTKALWWQVATFIVQKILLDDVGLDYICTTAERFFAVGRVLGNMVAALAEQPSSRLLKHIIRCYLRLSDNPRWFS